MVLAVWSRHRAAYGTAAGATAPSHARADAQGAPQPMARRPTARAIASSRWPCPSRPSRDRAYAYGHAIEDTRYGDTDALGHVNNAVYLAYFEAARGGYYAAVTGRAFGSGAGADERTFVIAEAHVLYRSPARFGEPLKCWCRVGLAGPLVVRSRVPA